MKNLSIILAVFFFQACAQAPHQRLQVDRTSVFFQGESLWRVTSKASLESQWLRDCYQGDLKKFTQQARLAYSESAKTVRYWVWVGNCLAWHEELREARFFLAMASQLAQSKADQAMVKNNLGVVYLRQARVRKAYEAFREAHELAPQFVTPAFNLAQLYVAQNLNAEALKILGKALFSKAQDPEIWHLMGLAHLQNGDLTTASSWLVQIPAPFYQREDFALTLAQWHLLSGRPQEAQELLKNLRPSGLKVTAVLSTRLQHDVAQELKAGKAAKK